MFPFFQYLPVLCNKYSRILEHIEKNQNVGTYCVNPLNANLTKWSNTLKQFISNLPTKYLRVFDHFVGFALKGLTINGWLQQKIIHTLINLQLKGPGVFKYACTFITSSHLRVKSNCLGDFEKSPVKFLCKNTSSSCLAIAITL